MRSIVGAEIESQRWETHYVAWLFRATFLAFVASIFGGTKEEILRLLSGVAQPVLYDLFISRMFLAFHIARSFDSLFIFYGETGFSFFQVTLGTTRRVP